MNLSASAGKIRQRPQDSKRSQAFVGDCAKSGALGEAGRHNKSGIVKAILVGMANVANEIGWLLFVESVGRERLALASLVDGRKKGFVGGVESRIEPSAVQLDLGLVEKRGTGPAAPAALSTNGFPEPESMPVLRALARLRGDS